MCKIVKMPTDRTSDKFNVSMYLMRGYENNKANS